MQLIQILPATLELVQHLNGGVRPKKESCDSACKQQPHFYVWNGPNNHAEIIHLDEYDRRVADCTQESKLYSK